MSNALKWAYPCFRPEGPKMQDGYPEWAAEMLPGLTKRELIAAMAMQGLLSGGSLGWADDDDRAEAVAQRAARHADALLAELERRDD